MWWGSGRGLSGLTEGSGHFQRRERWGWRVWGPRKLAEGLALQERGHREDCLLADATPEVLPAPLSSLVSPAMHSYLAAPGPSAL